MKRPALITPSHLWLAIILLASFIVRFGILSYAAGLNNPSIFVSNDTESYLLSARALLQTGVFSVSPQDSTPQIVRTPGYPLFLVSIFSLFGENWMAALAIQSILSAATIGLTYLIGARVWNERVGLLAALLLGLDINTLRFSFMLLTESLFAFFLTLFSLFFTILLSDSVNRKKRAAAFLAGLFLAIATHIRPVSYYLALPALIGWLIWEFTQKTDGRILTQNAALFLLPIILLVGGWQIRNARVAGDSQFSAIESINLINYRAAMIVAEREGSTRDDAMTRIYQEYKLDKSPGWGQKWRAAGLQIIRKNPLTFIKQYAKGLVNIFLGTGSEGLPALLGAPKTEASLFGDLLRLSYVEYVQRWIVLQPIYFILFAFSFAHMLLIYVCSSSGIYSQVKQGAPISVLFLLGTLLYLILISAGPEASSRFRVPVTPTLALFAASAITTLGNINSITNKKDV